MWLPNRLRRYVSEHVLDTRILVAVVLVSVVLALIATAVQLFLDYRRDVAAIEDRMEQIQTSYLESVSNNLWFFDDTQLEVQLTGIMRLPDMGHLLLRADTGQIYEYGTPVPERRRIGRSFDLRFNDAKRTHLGTLTVDASLEGTHRRLIDGALVILVTQTVKIFLIALFIVFLERHWVTRHLDAMANYARNLRLDTPQPPLVLPQRHAGIPDEIDAVAKAINDMRGSLVTWLQERKTAEAEKARLYDQLQKSRQLLEDIIDAATPLIHVKDSDGRYLLVNHRYEAVTGYTTQQLVGKTAHDLFPPEVAHAIEARERKVLAAMRVDEIEERLPYAGGTHTYLSQVFPLRDKQGKTYALCTISTDITERKHAERELTEYRDHLEEMVAERTAALQAALKELESFSYSVSHDLRAPLRAIDGFSKMLLDEYAAELDAVGQDHLRRVRAGAQRMASIIDDMLKLARVTKSEMHRAPVDLSELAESIVAELRRSQPQRPVDVAITPALVVNADPSLMRIAMENLLSNAWKYSAKNDAARIEFGVMRQPRGAAFFVRDNGVGFNMAYADKLFVPFQRLHNTNEFEGSGIGLATVQRIVRRHGGRAWVESAPEQGTTIYFTLSA